MGYETGLIGKPLRLISDLRFKRQYQSPGRALGRRNPKLSQAKALTNLGAIMTDIVRLHGALLDRPCFRAQPPPWCMP